MLVDLNNFDKNLINDVERILDAMGLDITTAIKMMFKKITNENDVSFLLQTPSAPSKTHIVSTPFENTDTPEKASIKMTKSKAQNLFRGEGITLIGQTTFASKNRGAYNYWANPNFEVLKDQWNLILNDWEKKELHLFIIPAGTLKSSMVVARGDKPYQIDLQIMYDDISFTDTRSKLSFRRFYNKTIKY